MSRLAHLREELLDQHADLRRRMEATRVASPAERGSLLAELAAALDAHHRFEEGCLRDFLAAADAWGPERLDALFEHHAESHRALDDGLRATPTPAAVDELLADLEAHMRAEEVEVLDLALFSDDLARPDTTDG